MDIFVTKERDLIIWRHSGVKPRWLFGYGTSKRTYNISIDKDLKFCAWTKTFWISNSGKFKMVMYEEIFISLYIVQTGHSLYIEAQKELQSTS